MMAYTAEAQPQASDQFEPFFGDNTYDRRAQLAGRGAVAPTGGAAPMPLGAPMPQPSGAAPMPMTGAPMPQPSAQPDSLPPPGMAETAEDRNFKWGPGNRLGGWQQPGQQYGDMELGGGPLKNPHWRGPGGARGPARGPGTRGQRSRSPSPPQHAGTYGGPPIGDVRVDLHDGRPASSPADTWWEGVQYR